MVHQKYHFLHLILLWTGRAILTSDSSVHGSSVVQCDVASSCSPEEQLDIEAASCNFSSSFCSYTQLTASGDANNWTISNGRAVVRSGQRIFSATSAIRSPPLNSSLRACLVFMYTECMPSQLSVRIEDDEGGSCVLMNESGRQNEVFTKLEVEVPRAYGRIAFVARSGGNPVDGNVTLKDVELRPGNCSTSSITHANTCTTSSTQHTSPLATSPLTTTVSETASSIDPSTGVTPSSSPATTLVTETASTTDPSTDNVLQTTDPQEPATTDPLREVTAVSSKGRSGQTAGIIAFVVIAIIILIVVGIIVWWKKKHRDERKVQPTESDEITSNDQEKLRDNNWVPPHDHFAVQETGRQGADNLSSDDTPVPAQAAVEGDQPNSPSPDGALTGQDNDDGVIHLDDDWGFNYETTDDPYDFGYLNTAPSSGLLY